MNSMEGLVMQPADPSPETLPGLEARRESIIEEARMKRGELLRNTLLGAMDYIDNKVPEPVKKTVTSALGFTILGHVERTKAAITGKDLSGEKVSNQQRILSGLVVTSAVLFYGLAGYAGATGSDDALEASAVTWTASLPLVALQMGPKIMGTLRSAAEASGKPRLVALVHGIDSIFERFGYDKIEEASREGAEALTQSHA